ncbi:MAG TPA: HD domain-containing protein [Terracidiphilus sp.]|nr:HD domain-containing protein [Terracidiphilus sp.]
MTDPSTQLFLTSRFTAAVDYARHLHIETRKATNIPYMAHLLGVASLVMGENGHASIPVTEDMVIAAILHDTVEDHGGTPRLRDIEHNFGANVARLVEGLTDSFVENADQKPRWEERKTSYVERLEGEPLDVQLISAADKLYNARTILSDYRDIGNRVFERFKRGGDKQLWYFRELQRVFRTQPSNRIVDEFERVVAELEAMIAKDQAG